MAAAIQMNLFGWAARVAGWEARHEGFNFFGKLLGEVAENWVPLSSSNLDAFKYSALDETLTIRFSNGREYEYYDVSPGIAHGLSQAASPGGYFHSQIKDVYLY